MEKNDCLGELSLDFVIIQKTLWYRTCNQNVEPCNLFLKRISLKNIEDHFLTDFTGSVGILFDRNNKLANKNNTNICK